MLTYVHLCICASWNHLDSFSLREGLFLHISCLTIKSGIAAHLSFLRATAHWQGCCCSPSWIPDLPSCPLALGTSGHGQEVLLGLWGGATQHCTLTPNFPEKEEGSSLISLNFWCVFQQNWSGCISWDEIWYRLNVCFFFFFKSLTKDRDIPITNQN